ncbi:Hsp70 family ATPase SSQ1 KNAG_0B05910 [Huiozyma naganishii CBS 8797]|uniref:Iron-sulfur cluster biogenesis chaperone, mitochondrial n=1 Tax=Huiozyma naganishii (strain ATCC MYA-139 / BCRC 22969 / CBS 8797 / KCTC 17520 / NBRC 10181 / NCYC 3082 / Yp74L-3) TaxID=1071383 RepID=J7S5A1_HUIN7|nr:hypothetical protein KNAG_0B05910 [Kazachstania naganishii CBS 8797]CCK69021.1 hypothetical protein KNAG_0B05910 [Kazachstania naganishii CBS 8797]
MWKSLGRLNWPLNVCRGRAYSSKVIGIDLGTTNSAVAYVRNATSTRASAGNSDGSGTGVSAPDAAIIENVDGGRTTPSIVAFPPHASEGEVLVGMRAKRQQAVNFANTFFATKRLIGRRFDDAEVQRDARLMPYKIVKQHGGKEQAAVVTTDGHVRSPELIGSYLLRYLKQAAEQYLNESVDSAVITVPAYFNDSQRQATKDAGQLAGLKVMRVVNEPTAAALSFGLGSIQRKGERKMIAVYDLGGGTFDISVLDIEDGVFEVCSTNGDTHLGGEDFDNVVVSYLVDQFVEQNKTQITREQVTAERDTMQRIKAAAEKSKIELSHRPETLVSIPFLHGNLHLSITLTEKELDNMTMHLIERTVGPVKRALADAELAPGDIDEVIMVGGMTRMPKIRAVVEELFGKKPNTSVNPDETVALGAAIQGGILSGEIKNVLLLDVTPLTLGIETFGGTFSPLIPRNTTVPVKKTEIFSTGVDGQTGVDIKVFQGERGLVRDNQLIGDFKLTGIPPMMKGTPQIAVTFDIDADGIINVSAMERSSGQEKSITVVANTAMPQEEIDRLLREAEENRSRDNAIRQRLELLAKADIMLSDTANTFTQHTKFFSADKEFPPLQKELAQLQTQLRQLRAEPDGDESRLLQEVNALKKNTDELQKKTFQLIQRLARPGNTPPTAQ